MVPLNPSIIYVIPLRRYARVDDMTQAMSQQKKAKNNALIPLKKLSPVENEFWIMIWLMCEKISLVWKFEDRLYNNLAKQPDYYNVERLFFC